MKNPREIRQGSPLCARSNDDVHQLALGVLDGANCCYSHRPPDITQLAVSTSHGPAALRVTVRTLRLAFARRHVLEHNGGVIDEDYLSQTGEGVLGRRIRVRSAFVEDAFAAIEKLLTSLS